MNSAIAKCVALEAAGFYEIKPPIGYWRMPDLDVATYIRDVLLPKAPAKEHASLSEAVRVLDPPKMPVPAPEPESLPAAIKIRVSPTSEPRIKVKLGKASKRRRKGR